MSSEEEKEPIELPAPNEPERITKSEDYFDMVKSGKIIVQPTVKNINYGQHNFFKI
jgi:hypothetical protein